jgi:hypothetical protein
MSGSLSRVRVAAMAPWSARLVFAPLTPTAGGLSVPASSREEERSMMLWIRTWEIE